MDGRIEQELLLRDAFSAPLQEFTRLATSAQQPLQALQAELNRVGQRYDVITGKLIKTAEAVKPADEAVKKSTGSFLGLTNGMLATVKGYLGVGAAVVALKLIMIDGIRGAMQEEQQVLALTNALQRLGQPVDMSAAFKYIDELSAHLGVADDEMRTTALTLARTGDISAAGILRMLPAIAGFKAEGKQMEQVASAIALALQGSTKGLKQFGIELEDGATKAEVLEAIKKRFASMAQVAEDSANSASGSLRKMMVAWGESKDSFGAGFLEQFSGGDSGINSIGELLKGVGREIGFVLKWALVLFETITLGVKTIWATVSTVIGFIVAGDMAMVRGIMDSFAGLKKVVAGTADFIGSALLLAFQGVKFGIQSALQWVIDKVNTVRAWFGDAPLELKFDTEKTKEDMVASGKAGLAAMQKVMDGTKEAGGAFGNAFSDEFGTAMQYAKDQLEGMTNDSFALRKAVGIKDGSNAGPTAPKGGDDLTAQAKAADAAKKREEEEKRKKALAEEILSIQKEGATAWEESAKKIKEVYEAALARIKSFIDPIRDAMNEPGTKAEQRTRDRDAKREQGALRQQGNLLEQVQQARDSGDFEKADSLQKKADEYGSQAAKYGARQKPGNALDPYEDAQVNRVTNQAKDVGSTAREIISMETESKIDSVFGDDSEIVGETSGGQKDSRLKPKSKKGKDGGADLSKVADQVNDAAKDVVKALQDLGRDLTQRFTEMSAAIAAIGG